MVVSAVRRPAALALFVLVLVLGAALLFDGLVAASIPHFKSPILNALVGTINPIGSGVMLLVVCVALAVMSRRIRRPRLHDAACISALAFASAGLIEFSLKHLVGRPRPDAALASAGLLGPSFAPDIDSFPSGHATSVFAVATVFAENALSYTRGGFDIRLEGTADEVFVAVSDSSPTLAVRRERPLGACPGGLDIVSALCHRWGNTPTSIGKTVWARIGADDTFAGINGLLQ